MSPVSLPWFYTVVSRAVTANPRYYVGRPAYLIGVCLSRFAALLSPSDCFQPLCLFLRLGAHPDTMVVSIAPTNCVATLKQWPRLYCVLQRDTVVDMQAQSGTRARELVLLPSNADSAALSLNQAGSYYVLPRQASTQMAFVTKCLQS